jgi:hypothetical protein
MVPRELAGGFFGSEMSRFAITVSSLISFASLKEYWGIERSCPFESRQLRSKKLGCIGLAVRFVHALDGASDRPITPDLVSFVSDRKDETFIDQQRKHFGLARRGPGDI